MKGLWECDLTWYGSVQSSAVGICDESDELWESITVNFLNNWIPENVLYSGIFLTHTLILTATVKSSAESHVLVWDHDDSITTH
jgi:hypothetical protein